MRDAYRCGHTGFDTEIDAIADHEAYSDILFNYMAFLKMYGTDVEGSATDFNQWLQNEDIFIPSPILQMFLDKTEAKVMIELTVHDAQ